MTSVLVVGVGSMGWNHSRVCSDLGILCGVCDSNDDLSRKVSSNFGVPGFSDVITALERLPHGVIVATLPVLTMKWQR